MFCYIRNISVFILISLGILVVSSCHESEGNLLECQELSNIQAKLMPFQVETGDTTSMWKKSVLRLYWRENDTIGVFPFSGTQIGFPLTNSAGLDCALIGTKGSGLKKDTLFFAYSPYICDQNLDLSQIPVGRNYQKQIGNGSYDHICQTDYLKFASAHIKGDMEGAVFYFKPLYSIIHVVLHLPMECIYNYVALETSGRFLKKATYDLIEGKLDKTEQSTLEVLSLNNIKIDNKDSSYLDLYIFTRRFVGEHHKT